MSVINQMLKDLDKRNPEVSAQNSPVGHSTPVHSTQKVILITSVTVILICAFALFIWQVISENNALKAEQISHKTALQNNNINGSLDNNVAGNAKATADKPVQAQVKRQSTATSPQQKSNDELVDETIAKKEIKERQEVNEPKTDTSQPIATKALANNASSKVTPATKAEKLASEQTDSDNNLSPRSVEKTVKAIKTEPKAKTSKMSVSRRQMSADELAEQKIALAEKAIAAKQIKKAEKLLEEAVILRPDDSQTRKKLAALWFGRQAYQDALNILSQGIGLDRKDSSLRELKARIYLKQRQYTAALNTLKPLAKLKNEQYQVLLANTAQQVQQNEIAANAYKVLISMQPELGRWHLGLAVLYDKNSQFELASNAYKKALTKDDLSVSSESFIKQRIEAIGQ